MTGVFFAFFGLLPFLNLCFVRLLFLVLMAYCGVGAVYAQHVGRGVTSPSNLEYISQQLEKGKGNKLAVGARGSALLVPYWTRGSVLTANGPVGPVWLKYDLGSAQLLWRRPAGDSLELNTAQVTEFTMGDSLRGTRATFRRYPLARIESPALRTAFFEVCYDAGKSALLRQRTKIIVSSSGGPSLTEGRLPSWQESLQYFVKRTDNRVMPVRLTEKAVLENLGPAHQSELAGHVKRERLNLRKPEDVARFLAYYDTL